MKQPTRMLVTLVGSIWLITTASLAQATFMYDFDVDFSGTSFTGSIELDNDAAGSYTPNGASGSQLLSFQITIDGILFEVTDDKGYPSYPAIGLDATGDIDKIDYVTNASPPDPYLTISYNTAASLNNVEFYAQFLTTTPKSGQVTGTSRVSAPEPSTLALLSMGLAVVGIQRRRARNKSTTNS
jgi:hypothetical protein